MRNNILCLFVGEKNSCYLPDSTFSTYNLVKEAHPSQQYSWIQIPEYGHLDCIYGRDAVHDVYPHILKALDGHAQDNLHLDDAARRHVLRAVKSLEFNSGTVVSHKKTNVRFYSEENQSTKNDQQLPACEGKVLQTSRKKSLSFNSLITLTKVKKKKRFVCGFLSRPRFVRFVSVFFF